MEHCMAVRRKVLSHIWLTLAAQLCYFHLSSAGGTQNLFCFDGSECAGNQDLASLTVEDCCLRHPAGSYLSIDPGMCVNCRSISLFYCKPSLCPSESTKCYCRISNSAANVVWNFNATQNLCQNNKIDISRAFNMSLGLACGSHLSATVEDCIEGDKSCQNSVLTVTGDATIDGVGITCNGTSPATSAATITVSRPPGAPLITGVDLTDALLTLQWNASSEPAGGIPISYNVTIQTSDVTLLQSVKSNGQSSLMLAVEVTESIVYDITIAALNCAGANQATHRLFNLSGGIRASMIVDIYDSVRLELVWINSLQTPSSYEVAVTTNGENKTTIQEQQCSASQCRAYVLQLTAFQSNYSIEVLSYTRQGVLVAKGTSTVEYLPEIAISKVHVQRNREDTVEIGCYFQTPQLHHCIVCCGFNSSATEPSVFNVSTSNYANTTVTLEGLRKNLLYDCAAAAVGTAVANCTSLIAGSVKLLFKIDTQGRVPETTNYLTATQTESMLSSLDAETLSSSLLIAILLVSLISLF